MRPLPKQVHSKTVAFATSAEPDGIGDLFEAEAPRLHRYFRQKTGDSDAAADLVQDSFLKMVAAPRTGLANPAAYLQRIARNLLADRFRKGQRQGRRDHISLDECDVAVPPVQEELYRYEQAVAGLSEKTRVVFLLQRVEGLTYEQISRKLGISISTVEYHMMRALAHIDRVLEAL